MKRRYLLIILQILALSACGGSSGGGGGTNIIAELEEGQAKEDYNELLQDFASGNKISSKIASQMLEAFNAEQEDFDLEKNPKGTFKIRTEIKDINNKLTYTSYIIPHSALFCNKTGIYIFIKYRSLYRFAGR